MWPEFSWPGTPPATRPLSVAWLPHSDPMLLLRQANSKFPSVGGRRVGRLLKLFSCKIEAKLKVFEKWLLVLLDDLKSGGGRVLLVSIF